ncbi:uncharacterized protein LOC106667183 isoform X2 [Cimex lectularius]|nr:uncharacterized protein LOC106667183 isoform X2 [Cimex lectularius]XP_014250437.1 uncharacterized protein LOC106667183 isoform X2 [Cimex lectularius]XP_014250438.1 uncharacterized protein LOC106667183 isoform X2 [Cimex lectularius]
MERPERHNRKLRRRQGFGSKKDCDKTNTHGSLQDLAQVHNLVPNQDEFCKSHAKNNSRQRLSSWKSGGQDINMIPYKEEDYSSIINNGNYGSFTNFYKLQQFISNETNIYKVVDDQTGASPYSCPEKKSCDENSQTAEDGVKTIIKTVTDEKEKSLLIAEALNREGLIEKKNLDENGNALGNNLEFKRKRRGVKAKNDKNTILSQHIEGHRSDIAQDIDALMKYIESPTHGEDKRGRQMNFTKNSGHIASKLQPRDKSSETLRKGRKSKDTQFHKSNSLEEVSVSKFEDLTQSEVKKSETQQDIKSLPLKLENKTECQKVEQKSCPTKLDKNNLEKGNKINPKPDSNVIMIENIMPRKEDPELQDAEFHTVTKKQKKRKNIFFVNRNRGREQHQYGHKQEYRHDYKNFYAHDNKQRGGLYSFKRKNDYHRRKSTSSVPSSEKSGESSDLDSVHSLPVSSTKVKRNEMNLETRANSNHTSYADIIKAVPTPSKQVNESSYISESCDKTSGSNDVIEPNEPVPSVMVSLPKKREKNSFSPICSPQDYPPLLHIGDSNQVNSSSHSRTNTSNNQSTSSNLISTAPSTANDSANKTSNSSNDMFVEFTLVVPPKDKYVNKCVNVEETVYVKIKPSDNVTPAPPPGEETVPKRPPVILLSRTKERPIVNDLEFGFEINEQLLQGEEELAVKKKPTVENSHLNQCKDNYYANVMKATSNGDIDSIIKFISSDWEYIQSGLAGEVKYFSG